MVSAHAPRRRVVGHGLLLIVIIGAAASHAGGQTPLVPGANVNIVRGTAFIGGDPYLQRQNEPSIAVSTRNPCHLLAGSNDYRTVDFPDRTPLPNEEAPPAAVTAQSPRDAWLGVYQSMDCGATWRSALLPGHPFDTSAAGTSSPNFGFPAGADPVVRAATNGLFFYAGLVFEREGLSRSQIFVARYIDNNNKERGDTIAYVDTSVVADGDGDVFVDKPWLAVDQPRAGAPMCDVNGQQFPAGRVYMAWAQFQGAGSAMMFSRSLDCGRSWQPAVTLATDATANQGASIAIAPHDGTVYVAWRRFARPGVPASIQVASSTDGGATFPTRRAVAEPINAFDQPKEANRRFRTNSLPTVAADHLGRVYVAWAERGFAAASPSPTTGDSRIVLAVSTNRGASFGARYAIDHAPAGRRGHQVMPSLTFTGNKLQALYYDFADDISGTFGPFVDEAETPPVDPDVPEVRLRHTVDVRAAYADPGAAPVFSPVLVTPDGTSPRLSQYRTIVEEDGTLRQVQFNPPNLPLFVAGTTPFIGDYIDVAGLNFVPSQGAWRHHNGTTSSPRFDGPFPAWPAFHAVWTDHRDVRPPADGDWTLYKAPGDPFWKMPGSECVPSRAGMRNANVYTARITNGLYAGSPGNTKPLGFRRVGGAVVVDPATGRPVHIQRAFVVFAQNTLDVRKKYLFRIVNQPGANPGDRASFVRTPLPPFSDADLTVRPHVWLVAAVSPFSTIARTVFVTAQNETAMVRVDVLEVAATAPEGIGSDPRQAPPPLAGGRRATVLLNPDRTNPPVEAPDFAGEVPSIAEEETHDPEIFDPVLTTIDGVTNSVIEIRNPDESNPDESNPDESNVDEETPDESNPDESNPDESNPDESNPDESNPDESNLALLNTALSDDDLATASIVDVQWKVRSRANTTTAFRFAPSYSGDRAGKSFQLLVTKRYFVPEVDAITCDLGVKRTNQVLVNIAGFDPRNPDESNPDESNPDESNPDESNPDESNPDESNPDESNPDESNPDESNATFFLAPGESATVTLRIYDTTTATAPPPAELAQIERQVAAEVTSFAPNTGEAVPPSDAAGIDLVALNPLASPANVAPGGSAQVTWTLANRGTDPVPAGTFTTRFVFSSDRIPSEDDRELAVRTFEDAVPADDPATPGVNEGELPQSIALTIPADVTPAGGYILLVIDALNEVPEADEANNLSTTRLGGAFALAFGGQPTNTTQGFTFASPVTVSVLDGSGLPAVGNVAQVRLAIASGPAGAMLGGSITAPNIAGLATFTNLTVSMPGVYTLVATAVGFEGPAFASPALSAPFQVEADDAPIAVPDEYVVDSNSVLDARGDDSRVTRNDVDELTSGPGVAPPGRMLLASLVGNPRFGTAALAANGGFLYTPIEGFNGVDFFTYRLNDGVTFGNTTTVRIAVGAGGGNAAPVTGPLSLTVDEDSSNTVDVLAAALDADGDPLSIVGAGSARGQALVSDGVLRYTPDPDFNGADTIEYVITDGTDSAGGTVAVTVAPVNDDPVARDDGPFTIAPGSGANTFQVLDNDDAGPDAGETLTVVSVGASLHGIVSFTPAGVSYTPETGYEGPDSYAYGISDGRGGAAAALVRVTVGVANVAPDAVDDSVSTAEDTPGTFDVVENDTDGDGHPLAITTVTQGTHGAVTIASPSTVGYAPGANFNGNDTFTYTVSDGHGGSDTATVTVIITTVNDSPTLVTELADVTVPEDAPPTIVDVGPNFDDVDIEPNDDVLSFLVESNTNPGLVSATLDGSILRLEYAPNQAGIADITIRATDLASAFVSDTFRVTVGATNDAPIAEDDGARTQPNVPVAINVLANDRDPDVAAGARLVHLDRFAAGLPANLQFPSDAVFSPVSNLLYLANGRFIAALSPQTHELGVVVPNPTGLAPGPIHLIDPARGVIYFRYAGGLITFDTRPSSPRFNQAGVIGIGGNVVAMAGDFAAGRLYLSTNAIGAGTSTLSQAQVLAVDVDPDSPSYHQVVGSLALPGTAVASSLFVDVPRNRLFVGRAGNGGVFTVDLDTGAVAQVAEAPGALQFAHDAATQRLYAVRNGAPAAVFAIDLQTGAMVPNSLFTVEALTFQSSGGRAKMLHDPATGTLYIRSNGTQNQNGVLVALRPGGDPDFWTTLAELPVGMDGGGSDVALDSVGGRVITASPRTARMYVIDTATNTIVSTITPNQPVGTLELMLAGETRRAYGLGLTVVQPVDLGTPPAGGSAVWVGAESAFVAVNPNSHVAFVSRTTHNSSVLKYDPDGAAGEIAGGHRAGRYGAVAVNPSPDVSEAYAVNVGADETGNTSAIPGFLAVLDASGTVTATYPVGHLPQFGLAVSRATGRVYSPSAGIPGVAPGAIHVVDPAAGTVTTANTGAFPPGTVFFRQIAVNEATGRVYFATSFNGPAPQSQLGFLDESTLVATRLPAFSPDPVNVIRVNSATNRIYVGTTSADGVTRILVLEGEDHNVIATLELGSPSTAQGTQDYIAVDEARARVYILDFERDRLHILDAETHELIRTIAVGDGPAAIGRDDERNRLYIPSANDSMLTFIDGESLAVRGALWLQFPATFMAVDSAEQRIYLSGGNPSNPGVAVVSDDDTFFTNPLTVASVTQPSLGTVAINADQTITYTPNPNTGGFDQFTYTASDGESTSEPANVFVTVEPVLSIVTDALPPGAVGDPYDQTLTATGGAVPFRWVLLGNTAPPGLSLSFDGRLAGTPTASGTFTFTVMVRDAVEIDMQTAMRTFTLAVGPPVILTTSLPDTEVGQAYSATLVAAGTTGAVTWSLVSGTIPEGLILEPSGLISGAPTTAGDYSFTVRVDDEAGQSATATVFLFVDGAPLLFDRAPHAVLHEFYGFAPYLVTREPATLTLVEGTLPTGLAISAEGSITGTPQETGRTMLVLRVTDGVGRVDERPVILDVGAGDQSVSAAPAGLGSVQPMTAARRLAQTMLVGTTGLLSGVRSFNVSCEEGAVVQVEIRRVSGADATVPDEDGPALANGVSDGVSSIVSLEPRVPVQAGERIAVVLTSGGGCEFERVTVSDLYQFGRALESLNGGAWQTLPGAPDLPVTLVVQPDELSYFTRSIGTPHTATLLPGGDLLVVASSGAAAELVTPATRESRPTANVTTFRRVDHDAVLLDDGRVLLVGGRDTATGERPQAAEVFVNGEFEVSGALAEGRDAHTTTKLPDGRVVVAGGSTQTLTIASVEIFDPAATTFSPGAPLIGPRRNHTATLLACPAANPGCGWGGKILIAGGARFGAPTAELYDPIAGTSVPTAGNMVDGRGFGSAAARLADGRVLLVGGTTGPAGAEVYDPATDSFTAVPGSAPFALERFTVTALADGDAIVAGGRGSDQWERDFRIGIVRFDAATDTFAGAGSLKTFRADTTATPLPDGRLLIAGGFMNSSAGVPSRSFEFFDPADQGTPAFMTTVLPRGEAGVEYPGAVLQAIGGTPPYEFNVVSGSLPPGLGLVNDTILGTPVAGTRGTFSFVVRVTDSAGAPRSAAMPFQIAVGAITITQASLPGATIGEFYDQQLTADGEPPLAWAITSGSVPAGLTFEPSGRIFGTPTSTTGEVSFRVRLTDALGQMTFRWFFIDVTDGIAITTTTLRDAVASQGYGVPIQATGGGGGRTWTVESGSLPNGLTLSNFGSLNGSPWETGDFAFTVRVTDSSGRTDAQALMLHVAAFDAQWFASADRDPTAVRPARRLAQAITAGASGTLYGLRINAACDLSETLTMQVQGVDANGRPDGTVLMSDGPSPVALSVTGAPPSSFEVVPLPGRRFLSIGARIAVVVSASGDCQVAVSDETGGAQVFEDTGSGWQSVGYDPLALGTVIDPQTTLQFFSWVAEGSPAVHLTCPSGVPECSYADQVLVVGNSTALQTWDVATRRSSVTFNHFADARHGATATRLPDGRVLIAAGWVNSQPSGTAVIFDPQTRTTTPTGSLNFARTDHRAVLLNDGRVLVVGGLGGIAEGPRPGVAEAETWDPGTGQWAVAGSMVDTRTWHTATLLACPAAEPACAWGGQVLVFGGYTDTWPLVAGELFNPDTDAFTAIGGTIDRTRAEHAAALMADGRVFLAGGRGSGFPGVLNTTEIFDPSTGTLADGPDMSVPRYGLTATRLPDESVILAGGRIQDEGPSTNLLERFLPGPGTIGGAGALGVGRSHHDATLLSGGTVLFSGGYNRASRLQAVSVEVVQPATGLFFITTALPDGRVAEDYAALVAATGGTPPYSMQVVDGELPPGLFLALQDGLWVIDGVPTAAGVFPFTIRVADSLNAFATQRFTIRIVESLEVLQTTPPTAATGVEYDVQLVAAGGAGVNRTWSLVPGYGRPPMGIALSPEGRLAGTPAEAGSFSFKVRVVDDATPPQAIEQRIRMSVAMPDRSQGEPPSDLTIVSPAGGFNYGQTFIPGRSGRLTSVQLFTSCSAGSLVLSIHEASGPPFAPAANVLASAATLPGALPDPPSWRHIEFPTPAFVRAGRPYAFVAWAAGDCMVGTSSADLFNGGGLHRSSVTDPFNWTGQNGDFSFEIMIEPLELSAFGTPAMDGVHTEGEWENAAPVNLLLNAPNGDLIPATVLVQNDATNMYLSLVYERNTFEQFQNSNVYFDGDNDGDPFRAGEDALHFATSPTHMGWFDDHHQSYASCAPFTCIERDELVDPALEHGSARSSYVGRSHVVEVSKPLNSGDTLDLAAALGQTIGFRIDSWIGDGAVTAFTNLPPNTAIPWTFAADEGTCVLAPHGLVAWWSADAVPAANDVQGSHHGTLQGTASTGAGRFGQAFSFDGGGSVTVPDAGAFSNHANAGGELTVEAWVNLASLPTSGDAFTILAKGGDSAPEYELQVTDEGAFAFQMFNTGLALHASVSGGPATPGQWHHVVGTYRSGRSARLWVDGVLIDEDTTLVGVTADTATPLHIGARGGSFRMVGSIDEPAVFSREMLPDEVRTLFLYGKCRTPEERFTLRVVVAGQGSVTSNPAGIICGGSCAKAFAQGTAVTLAAAPAPFGGVTFVGYEGDCAGQTCTVTMNGDRFVRAVFTSNFPPWADWQNLSTTVDTPIDVTLTGGDPEGQPITFSIVTQPAHGTLSPLDGANVTYTPAPGFTGTDSFTFRTFDGVFSSGDGVITIDVTDAGSALAFLQSATSFTPASSGAATLERRIGGVPVPAPAGGLEITVESSDAGCVGVLTSMTMPAGASIMEVSFVYGGTVPPPCTALVVASHPSHASASIPVTVNSTDLVRMNVFGPGSTLVSYLNPAPVPAGALPPAGAVGLASYFNPAPVDLPPEPTAFGGAATVVSFFSPDETPEEPQFPRGAVATVSFFSPVDPDGAPAAPGGAARIVSFVTGPSIHAVTPGQLSLSATMPQVLTLTGENLNGAITVTFSETTGITVGPPVVADDGRSLTVSVVLAPEAPEGAVHVSVSTAAGTSPITSNTHFLIVP